MEAAKDKGSGAFTSTLQTDAILFSANSVSRLLAKLKIYQNMLKFNLNFSSKSLGQTLKSSAIEISNCKENFILGKSDSLD